MFAHHRDPDATGVGVAFTNAALDLDGNLLISNDPFSGVKVLQGRLVLNDRPGIGVLMTNDE